MKVLLVIGSPHQKGCTYTALSEVPLTNKYGERITTRGISGQLKKFADKYGIDKNVVMI